MIEKLLSASALKWLTGAGGFIGMILAAWLFMDTYFAQAEDLRDTNWRQYQYQIDSSRKERRALRRDYRQSESTSEKGAIKADIDEVEDEIKRYEAEQRKYEPSK